MINHKRSLFEMVLRASPFPGFVFHPTQLKPETAKEGLWIENSNNKMETLKTRISLNELFELIRSSTEYHHPAVFPYRASDEDLFAVTLPLIEGPAENLRICFFVNNPTGATFTPPLLKEDSWHEINNPLAIISLSLQRALKKVTLNQEDIDNLLEKINNTFVRIEAYILGQIELS